MEFTNHMKFVMGKHSNKKQNEVTMDKPIHVGFAILELSKLHMYETYYDRLQPYFG